MSPWSESRSATRLSGGVVAKTTPGVPRAAVDRRLDDDLVPGHLTDLVGDVDGGTRDRRVGTVGTPFAVNSAR